MSQSPIFYNNGSNSDGEFMFNEPAGWYFFHENWADYSGPFDTEEEAGKKQLEYAKTL